MLHSRGERGTFILTTRRVTRAHVLHRVQAASSQKSLGDSPTQPRSTFYHEKLHQYGVNDVFHSFAKSRREATIYRAWYTYCMDNGAHVLIENLHYLYIVLWD